MADEEMYRQIVELLSSGDRAVLATVVAARGSTPRKVGAKLLVRGDGQIIGSIGGGIVEATVIEEAGKLLARGGARIIEFSLDGKEGLDAICGGELSVFVEVLGRGPELVILGGGHVGQALSRLAKTLHFNVVVVDDRDEFASRDRFPRADAVVVQGFDEFLKTREFSTDTQVVIVTRGHTSDALSLRLCLDKGAGYLGMIGSKRKVRAIFDELRQAGCGEAIERVHAPIGLDIGAQTPEEIAVSIMAEILAVRSGRRGGFMKDAV